MEEIKFGNEDKAKIDEILLHTNRFLRDATYCEQVKTDLIKMSCSENIEKGVDYSAAMLAYLDTKKKAGYSSCGARKAIKKNLHHHYVRLFQEHELKDRSEQVVIARKNAVINKENSL